MTKLILSIVLICSVVYAGNTGSHKPHVVDWQENIPGVYQGTLFAAGYDMPVTTTFYFENGVLLGSYLMDEDGTLTPGQLSNITFEENYIINCIWTDTYGTGPVHFAFTDDCSGFTGFWSGEASSNSYSWWGTKEETEIQQLVRD